MGALAIKTVKSKLPVGEPPAEALVSVTSIPNGAVLIATLTANAVGITKEGGTLKPIILSNAFRSGIFTNVWLLLAPAANTPASTKRTSTETIAIGPELELLISKASLLSTKEQLALEA